MNAGEAALISVFMAALEELEIGLFTFTFEGCVVIIIVSADASDEETISVFTEICDTPSTQVQMDAYGEDKALVLTVIVGKSAALSSNDDISLSVSL